MDHEPTFDPTTVITSRGQREGVSLVAYENSDGKRWSETHMRPVRRLTL
jgi:hypothetical protein